MTACCRQFGNLSLIKSRSSFYEYLDIRLTAIVFWDKKHHPNKVKVHIHTKIIKMCQKQLILLLISVCLISESMGTDNLFKPSFSNCPVNITIFEWSPPNTEIYRLTAVDNDGDDVTFELLKSVPGSAKYEIGKHSGVIQYTKASRNSYNLNEKVHHILIRISDNGLPILFDTCVITIRTINNNHFSPVFEKDHYNISVASTATKGSSVLATLATDSDNGPEGTLTYTMRSLHGLGQNKDYFAINKRSGEIFILNSLSTAPRN